MNACVSVCVNACVNMGDCGGQKRVSAPLELEFQAAGSCPDVGTGN